PVQRAWADPLHHLAPTGNPGRSLRPVTRRGISDSGYRGAPGLPGLQAARPVRLHGLPHLSHPVEATVFELRPPAATRLERVPLLRSRRGVRRPLGLDARAVTCLMGQPNPLPL